MVRQEFTVVIYTDGMDFPKDMQGIVGELRKLVPEIARHYVHLVQPSEIRWIKKGRRVGPKPGAGSPRQKFIRAEARKPPLYPPKGKR